MVIPYRCSECSYTTRALQCLRTHYRRVHECVDMIHPYQCHACHRCFSKGTSLSDHLIEIHNFQLPPGHARFRYQEDENGVYHLQTVRFESTHLGYEGEGVGKEDRSVLNLTGQEVEACQSLGQGVASVQSSEQLVLLHGLIVSDSQESIGDLFPNSTTGLDASVNHHSILDLINVPQSSDSCLLSNDLQTGGNKHDSVTVSQLEGFADPQNLQLLSETCCSLAHLPGETSL